MNLPAIFKLTEDFDKKYGGKPGPGLEEYLRSLWGIVSGSRDLPQTHKNVASWLERAFTEEPPQFDPVWMLLPKAEYAATDTFEEWEKVILYQIADLRRMANAGMLDNPYRGLGLTSPSGLSWYNFEPLIYLDCGMAGLWDKEYMWLEETPGEDALFSWREFSDLLFLCRIYE